MHYYEQFVFGDEFFAFQQMHNRGEEVSPVTSAKTYGVELLYIVCLKPSTQCGTQDCIPPLSDINFSENSFNHHSLRIVSESKFQNSFHNSRERVVLLLNPTIIVKQNRDLKEEGCAQFLRYYLILIN